MEFQTPKLFYTIGLQRSGKSTYCTQWARGLQMLGRYSLPRAVVCDDSFRIALRGDRYKHEAEDMVFTMSRYAIKALLERGHDVIHDETHTTERSIREVLTIDPVAEFILIDTPKAVCLERAVLTNQEDLIPVIERCHTQLEKLKAYGLERAVEQIRAAVRRGEQGRVLSL